MGRVGGRYRSWIAHHRAVAVASTLTGCALLGGLVLAELQLLVSHAGRARCATGLDDSDLTAGERAGLTFGAFADWLGDVLRFVIFPPALALFGWIGWGVAYVFSTSRALRIVLFAVGVVATALVLFHNGQPHRPGWGTDSWSFVCS